ncbi:Multidrug resistance-associated protein 4 [Nymphon striatum]|nr:Multidrug resistance-associated protein 4 [Nymphon striatum]
MNFLQLLPYSCMYVFVWTFPTLLKGWKGELNENDSLDVPSCLRTEKLEKEFSRLLHGKTFSIFTLLISLFKIAKWDLFLSFGMCCFQEWILKPCLPLIFSMLLIELQNWENNKNNVEMLYSYTALCCIMFLVSPLAAQNFYFYTEKAGIVLRNALCSAIYKKITKISHQGFTQTDTGEIMNIVTNDVNRFDQDFKYLNFIIISPIQWIIVSCILWQAIGLLPLIGMGVLMLALPLQAMFSKYMFNFRKKVIATTDARIKLIHEIIGAMKIIKLYSWEDSFAHRLMDKRRVMNKPVERPFNCRLYRGGTLIDLQAVKHFHSAPSGEHVDITGKI